MVEIKDLTMRFGKQLLFENVNLSLDKGRRYGKRRGQIDAT